MLLLLQIGEIASRYQLHTSLLSRSALHIRQKVSFKRKHRGVLPVQGPWSGITKTSHLKLKREVSRTERRFKIAIMFSGRRRRSREERNGFVKADVVK